MTIKDAFARYGVCAAGVAFIALLHFYRPTDNPRWAVCMLRRMTGLPCPTCGMTRAFAALAKGEMRMAIAHNPLSPLFAAVAATGWLYASWQCMQGKPFPTFTGRHMLTVVIALGSLAVAMWIVRELVPRLRGVVGGGC